MNGFGAVSLFFFSTHVLGVGHALRARQVDDIHNPRHLLRSLTNAAVVAAFLRADLYDADAVGAGRLQVFLCGLGGTPRLGFSHLRSEGVSGGTGNLAEVTDLDASIQELALWLKSLLDVVVIVAVVNNYRKTTKPTNTVTHSKHTHSYRERQR